MRSLTLAMLLVGAISSHGPSHAELPAGSLDPSLGGAGKVAYQPWGPNAAGVTFGMEPSHIAQQADGKLLVAGNTTVRVDGTTRPVVPARSAVILRVLEDGTVDSDFGSGGYAFVALGPQGGYGLIVGMVVLPDQRILVVSQLSLGSGNSGIFLTRLLHSGAADPSFGVNGYREITRGLPGQRHDCGVAIVRTILAPDGFLYMLCVNDLAQGPQTSNWLLKVDQNGVVDTSFGNNGTAPFPAHVCQPRLTDLIATRDGGFAATGTNVFCQGVYIMKLRADGSPYPFLNGWGLAGASRYPGWVLENGRRIVETPDGKLVTAGDAGTGQVTQPSPDNPQANYWLHLIRFNANGLVDTSFGTSGRAQHASPGDRDAGFGYVNYSFPATLGLHQQQDGKLLFGVSVFRSPALGAFTNPGYNVLLFRLNEDGSRDGAYAADGRWYERLNLYANPATGVSAYENAAASLLDSKGRLVVAGYASYGVTTNGATTDAPAFLLRLTGEPDGPCGDFADVSSTSDFCPSVEWLRNRGVTLGCTTYEFCPTNPVTRLAMAAFMSRLGRTLSSAQLPTVAESITTTLSAPQVACISDEHSVDTYPANAYLRGSTSLQHPDASLVVAVEHVYSTDGGNTWVPVAGSHVRQAVYAGRVPADEKTIVTHGTRLLDVGTSVKFAMRFSAPAGTASLGIYCVQHVRLENRNSATPPY